jgi:DNA-directed RNA polymerase alpha subunit
MPSIIHDLELSVRTTNVLNAMGTVQTYDDFMALTKEQVLSLKGLGTKAWHEIREVQQNIGRDQW